MITVAEARTKQWRERGWRLARTLEWFLQAGRAGWTQTLPGLATRRCQGAHGLPARMDNWEAESALLFRALPLFILKQRPRRQAEHLQTEHVKGSTPSHSSQWLKPKQVTVRAQASVLCTHICQWMAYLLLCAQGTTMGNSIASTLRAWKLSKIGIYLENNHKAS